jgi:hypothetical protein
MLFAVRKFVLVNVEVRSTAPGGSEAAPLFIKLSRFTV